ncbi:MAG TPA: sialidase family protein [Microbacteriaceae bacterium]|nr:sialidase family protein [Microbacteriaceae bacterium]
MRAHVRLRRIAVAIAAAGLAGVLGFAPAASATTSWSPLESFETGNLTVPAVASTTSGALLSIAGYDAGSGEELTVFRSSDNGQTWSIGPALSTNGGTSPSVAALPNGRVVAAWTQPLQIDIFTSTDQLWVATSTDNGASWSSPVAISEGARSPQVAAVGDGAAVTWFKLDGFGSSVSTILSPDGLTWSEPHQSPSGYVVFGPAIAVNSTGGIAVGWTESITESPAGVATKIATYDGTNWSDVLGLVEVHRDPPFVQLPSLTAAANGDFVMISQAPIMTDEPVNVSTVSPEGTLVNSSNFTIPVTANSTQIVRASDGTLVAGWVQPGEFDIDSSSYLSSVVMVRSTDNGLTWSDPVELTESTLHANAFTLAAGPAGRLFMAFSTSYQPLSGASSTVYAITSSDSGASWDTERMEVGVETGTPFIPPTITLGTATPILTGGFLLSYGTDTGFIDTVLSGSWRVYTWDLATDTSTEPAAVPTSSSLAATGSNLVAGLAAAGLLALAGSVLARRARTGRA